MQGTRPEAEHFGRCEPPVACDHAVFAVPQARVREAEFPDAGRDLRHLDMRMNPAAA
jgi:hypothetical protein